MADLIKRFLILLLELGLGSCPRGEYAADVHMNIFQMTCIKMAIEVIDIIALKDKHPTKQ